MKSPLRESSFDRTHQLLRSALGRVRQFLAPRTQKRAAFPAANATIRFARRRIVYVGRAIDFEFSEFQRYLLQERFTARWTLDANNADGHLSLRLSDVTAGFADPQRNRPSFEGCGVFYDFKVVVGETDGQCSCLLLKLRLLHGSEGYIKCVLKRNTWSYENRFDMAQYICHTMSVRRFTSP